MPATGTPEPGGFFFDEASEILRAVAETAMSWAPTSWNSPRCRAFTPPTISSGQAPLQAAELCAGEAPPGYIRLSRFARLRQRMRVRPGDGFRLGAVISPVGALAGLAPCAKSLSRYCAREFGRWQLPAAGVFAMSKSKQPNRLAGPRPQGSPSVWRWSPPYELRDAWAAVWPCIL